MHDLNGIQHLERTRRIVRSWRPRPCRASIWRPERGPPLPQGTGRPPKAKGWRGSWCASDQQTKGRDLVTTTRETARYSNRGSVRDRELQRTSENGTCIENDAASAEQAKPRRSRQRPFRWTIPGHVARPLAAPWPGEVGGPRAAESFARSIRDRIHVGTWIREYGPAGRSMIASASKALRPRLA